MWMSLLASWLMRVPYPHRVSQPPEAEQPSPLTADDRLIGRPVQIVKPQNRKLNKWLPLNFGMIHYTAKTISVEMILPRILAAKSIFLLSRACFSAYLVML